MLPIFLIFIVIAISVVVFMRQPKFGKIPSGKRLERIKNSPNFRNGKFQNLNHTPYLTEGISYLQVLKEFILNKSKRIKPVSIIPSIKTDLNNLNPGKNIFVWFGHSSYFMQIDGKKILVDPVLSGSASPVAATTRSFKGSDIYTVADIPEIDFLFITHDHWDHLDYETILKLKPKVKKIICGLGTAQHLEHWGFNAELISELDWHEKTELDNGFIVNTAPARHFSGRGFKRNKALWMSYVLSTPTMKIYIGGDSGYDNHFENIGNQFGPFDLAILECGQYNKSWKYIHMTPEETVRAARDLKATKLIPVHWSKFALAMHDWDDPIIRISNEVRQQNVLLLNPMIGQTLLVNQEHKNDAWWTSLA